MILTNQIARSLLNLIRISKILRIRNRKNITEILIYDAEIESYFTLGIEDMTNLLEFETLVELLHNK